jgi:hypothetical protein
VLERAVALNRAAGVTFAPASWVSWTRAYDSSARKPKPLLSLAFGPHDPSGSVTPVIDQRHLAQATVGFIDLPDRDHDAVIALRTQDAIRDRKGMLGPYIRHIVTHMPAVDEQHCAIVAVGRVFDLNTDRGVLILWQSQGHISTVPRNTGCSIGGGKACRGPVRVVAVRRRPSPFLSPRGLSGPDARAIDGRLGPCRKLPAIHANGLQANRVHFQEA